MEKATACLYEKVSIVRAGEMKCDPISIAFPVRIFCAAPSDSRINFLLGPLGNSAKAVYDR